METRFIKQIGLSFKLRIYWGEGCSTLGCHNATRKIKDIIDCKDWNACGKPEDYDSKEWPSVCDDCGVEVPNDDKVINKQVFASRLYNTPSGKPEPGCLYWADWLPETTYWDNHKGPHLIAVLPNGWEWNIDSRASNCDMKEDRLHRCWCRHGNPKTEKVTVDKNGNTCRAGAGSIMVQGYHGFLQNGVFRL